MDQCTVIVQIRGLPQPYVVMIVARQLPLLGCYCSLRFIPQRLLARSPQICLLFVSLLLAPSLVITLARVLPLALYFSVLNILQYSQVLGSPLSSAGTSPTLHLLPL